MLIISALSCIMALLYCAMMLRFYRAWQDLPNRPFRPDVAPQITVSVLLPVRNEAAHILSCLTSILTDPYPRHLLEIIVIDDHSDDQTAVLVNDFITAHEYSSFIKIHTLPANQTGKKAALTAGNAIATGHLILTTDADCTVTPHWISSTVQAHQQHPFTASMGIGPVCFEAPGGIFSVFQALDFAGMIGITGAGIHLGGPYMGNGANLSYTRSLFTQVGGYQGNAQIASGDDMFLVQQVARQCPEAIFFLKNTESIVSTPPMPNMRSFFRQRLRWGTKNTALPDWSAKLALLLVLLLSLTILVQWIIVFFFPEILPLLLFQTGLKMAADWLFLGMMSRFFDQRHWMRYFLPAFVLHLIYIVCVGIASLIFKEFEWKGRRFK